MKKWIFFILIYLLFISCQQKNNNPDIKLVVYVSIDQMRADYLSDSLYGNFLSNDGFRYLQHNGMNFQYCFHDHACTMTGPGHSTLGTGDYAHKTGIVGNEFWDEKGLKFNYCVYDSTQELVTSKGIINNSSSSPNQLLVSSLGDEMKNKDSQSKVFGISMKDRAAILMSGKHSDGAFWYSTKSGDFVTSTYYMKKLPDWIKEFNTESDEFLKNVFVKGWTRKLPESAYQKLLGKDDRVGEADIRGMGTSFPHPLNGGIDSMSSSFYKNITVSPYADMLLNEFAKKIIQNENLGKDEHPDLLCISYSATDYIGHTFGPFSHEMMDNIIRLDSTIADLRKFLDKYIGKENYLFVISADHGVAPLPEYSKAKGIFAQRINANIVEKKANLIFQEFSGAMKEKHWIKKITSNYIYLTKKGRKVYQKHEKLILQKLKGLHNEIKGIKTIYSSDEILNNPAKNKIFRRIKNAYYPGRSGDFYILPEPYSFFGYPGKNTGTTHGTPYDYDAHVPFIIYGGNLHATEISDTVGTADIAVSLSEILHIKDFMKNRDGVNVIK